MLRTFRGEYGGYSPQRQAILSAKYAEVVGIILRKADKATAERLAAIGLSHFLDSATAKHVATALLAFFFLGVCAPVSGL